MKQKGKSKTRLQEIRKYPEEDYAYDLSHALIAAGASETELSVTGAGVSWDCTATRGSRECRTHCFEHRDHDRPRVPQYLVVFKHDAESQAYGRTLSKPETVEAIISWLDRQSVAELHTHFVFVDQMQRSLTAIEKAVVEYQPELAQLTRDIHQIWGDLYEFRFKSEIRSCTIKYYGSKPQPDCYFAWDDCRLFEFPASDLSQLASVLKRWLCDNAMPSEMRAEFSWLQIGTLADYYEAGHPIEGEFIKSWDDIESFYENLYNYPQYKSTAQVLSMIAEMRQAGYDKTLRAGTSLATLILSRSRRHGMRDGQPGIAFLFGDQSMKISYHTGTDKHSSGQKLSVDGIKLTPEVKALLDQLANHDID